MKSFPAMLDSILTKNKEKFTASAFADSADIHNGDLSRIRSGQKDPTPEFFNKLITSPLLQETEAHQLAVAYLRDGVPAHLKDTILIRLVDTDCTFQEATDLLSEALEYFRQRGRTDPETYNWIVDTYKFVTGKSTQ